MTSISFIGIIIIVFRWFFANGYCFWIERVDTSLFEPCTHISRHDRIKPGISEHLTEVVLRYDLGGILLIERVARLLPVSFEWSEEANIKGLALVCGVGWETEDNDLIILCKLNAPWFEVGTVPIKQKEKWSLRNSI